MKKVIYLDNAATTRVRPEVVEAMLPYFTEHYGNPSSVYDFSTPCKKAMAHTREVIAGSLGASENEIYFTNGGTEADNWALKAAAEAYASKGKHIITTQIEHHAVLHTGQYLEKLGYEVTYLPVDENGVVSVDALKKAVRPDTILISVMFANNEIGTIEPIREIGEVAKEHGILFHTDAVQAYCHEPINVDELHIDMLSASAHKFNGPKGVGFLYVKPHHMDNLLHGGEQEEKRRASTENMIGITGMAQAFKEADQLQEENYQKISQLGEDFLKQLSQKGVDYYLNGGPNRLPHVINIGFPGQNNGLLLTQLDLAGFAVSTGSACTAGTVEPSHVLQAFYGTDSPRLSESIRISLSDLNTSEELSQLATKLKEIIG